jgi:hypothetical protein
MPARGSKANEKAASANPPSRLMRVPHDTYELIQKWAQSERRHLNQQLAVIVEEWDRAQGRQKKGV